jgi:putative ABC transport system permease protein
MLRFSALLGFFIMLSSLSQGASLPDLLIQDRTARRLGVSVGDTAWVSADPQMAGARAFRVSGTYSPVAEPAEVGKQNNYVKMHLPDLEQLSGTRDEIDRVVLKLRDRGQSGRVRTELSDLGLGFDAYTTEELASRTSQTFVVVAQFHKAIGAIALVASAIFLIALMVLRVEERKRELGFLRLIGISRATVLKSLVWESGAIALTGSLLGIAFAYAASWLVNTGYQARFDTSLVFSHISLDILSRAVLLSLGIGVLTGLLIVARLLRWPILKLVGR